MSRVFHLNTHVILFLYNLYNKFPFYVFVIVLVCVLLILQFLIVFRIIIVIVQFSWLCFSFWRISKEKCAIMLVMLSEKVLSKSYSYKFWAIIFLSLKKLTKLGIVSNQLSGLKKTTGLKDRAARIREQSNFGAWKNLTELENWAAKICEQSIFEAWQELTVFRAG